MYRNLKTLQEMGLVAELNLNGAVSRFQVGQEGHYPFHCEECGQAFDIDEPVDKELGRRVAGRTGLRICRHQLEFRGGCARIAGMNEYDHLEGGGMNGLKCINPVS